MIYGILVIFYITNKSSLHDKRKMPTYGVDHQKKTPVFLLSNTQKAGNHWEEKYAELENRYNQLTTVHSSMRF